MSFFENLIYSILLSVLNFTQKSLFSFLLIILFYSPFTRDFAKFILVIEFWIDTFIYYFVNYFIIFFRYSEKRMFKYIEFVDEEPEFELDFITFLIYSYAAFYIYPIYYFYSILWYTYPFVYNNDLLYDDGYYFVFDTEFLFVYIYCILHVTIIFDEEELLTPYVFDFYEFLRDYFYYYGLYDHLPRYLYNDIFIEGAFDWLYLDEREWFDWWYLK